MKKLFLYIATVCLMLGFATSAFSESAEFNGNQYFFATDINDVTGDITIEMWIYPNIINVNQELIDKYNTTNNRSYRFFIRNTNKLEFWYSADGSSTNQTKISSIFTISSGVWQHIAVAVDVSAKKATFVLNGQGELSNNYSGSDTSIYDSAANFEIGAQTETGFFNGKIDDVRIWDYALSESEIKNNYQTELSGYEVGLRACYKFDGDATDSSSNGNNLNNYNCSYSSDVPFKGEDSDVDPVDPEPEPTTCACEGSFTKSKVASNMLGSIDEPLFIVIREKIEINDEDATACIKNLGGNVLASVVVPELNGYTFGDVDREDYSTIAVIIQFNGVQAIAHIDMLNGGVAYTGTNN